MPSDRPNGVSCQAHRLANALVEKGHTVTCFSLSPGGTDALYRHVKLDYSCSARALRKFEPAALFRKVEKSSFDILHFHGDDYYCRGSHNRVRTFYGSALYEALHAKTAGRFCYQFLFYLFELVSCFRKGTKVGISQVSKRPLIFVADVIPCGVPLNTYTPDNSLKTAHPSILFLGDFNSRKRGAFLLNLFKNDILKRHPDCTLTVVGPQPCAQKQVIYAGVVTEAQLIREYQKSWMLCVPSSYEGFGVPIIEAMACGTPVIAVDNPGIREIVTHDHNGFIVKDAELGRAISTVVTQEQKRAFLSANARKTVVQKYAMEKIAADYEKIYNSVCIKR